MAHAIHVAFDVDHCAPCKLRIGACSESRMPGGSSRVTIARRSPCSIWYAAESSVVCGVGTRIAALLGVAIFLTTIPHHTSALTLCQVLLHLAPHKMRARTGRECAWGE